MKQKINTFLLIGIIGTFVFGAQFAVQYGKAVWGSKTIWWTPMPLALPLSETGNNFKIFINNELLDNHIERGSLSAKDSAGQTYRVAPENIRVGLNNWPEVRASFLHASVFAAFFLGVSLTLLILGLGQIFRPSKIN
jgi:hypothetical protein